MDDGKVAPHAIVGIFMGKDAQLVGLLDLVWCEEAFSKDVWVSN